MSRALRTDVGEMVYHVLNRANNRVTIFHSAADYRVFESLLEDLVNTYSMRIIAYCLMPNHWHLILHTKYDGQLAECMRWLTTTHTRRWHRDRKTVGGGHLYQGRYKSFPVETNQYLLQLIRYVERNPFRAKLVSKAEDWQYSSLYKRKNGEGKYLSDTIIDLPRNYFDWVNESESDLEEIRFSVNKGKPFGSDTWILDTASRFKLQSTMRGQGRPKKY